MAPDAASVKAGRKLGSAGKWKTLGRSPELLWGEFKGSGSNPYQTCIELAEPAFKCSCPSRKFPCKHALGLSYVYAEQASALAEAEPPAWVAEWQQKRTQRAAKKAVKADQADKPVDEATRKRREKARQKRAEDRQQKVSQGVADLQRWLQDLVRQGFAQQDDSGQDGYQMAARMVDAQAPGLARWLQQITDLRYHTQHWQEASLDHIARLHLLLQAYEQRENLPAHLQADINNLIGFTQSKEELLKQDGVPDRWLVLAQQQEQDAQLQMQSTWLWGQQHQGFALLLDFAYNNQVLPVYPDVGTTINAELVFYEGSRHLRAVIKAQDVQEQQADNAGFCSEDIFCTGIEQALQQYAGALSESPWIFNLPVSLGDVIPMHTGEQWLLVDKQGYCLPLSGDEQRLWSLYAISGGHPLTVFALWDGSALQVLSVYQEKQAYNLASLNLELAG